MNISQIIMYGFAGSFFLLIIIDLIKNKFPFHKMFMDEKGDPQVVQFISLIMVFPFLHLINKAGADPTKMYLALIITTGVLTFFPELTRDLINRAVRMWLKIKGKDKE